jgi:uncharacterized protein (DUF58 family)
MKKLRSARFGYILSLASALAASALFGGTVAYSAAAALAMLPLAAFLLAWCSERQLSVRHALDKDYCLRGENVRYVVRLRNRGIVPLTCAEIKCLFARGLTVLEENFQAALAPLATTGHIAEFSPPHRGLYSLSVESVSVSDPFRLTGLSGRCPGPLTLTVMPKLIPLSEAWKQRLDPQGAGGLFSQSSDEPAVDNRLYRYGDSPRRIHWNLTARKNELMVRQYESIESRRLLVALDLSAFDAADPAACEDTLIESCLSVVRYALERQIETSLVFAEGRQIRCLSGRDSHAFGEIHRAMATVEFNAELPLPHLLGDAEQAQMIYLFCMNAPGSDTLSVLPQDRPVELAVVRTRQDGAPPPESMGFMRVTELIS